MALTFDGSNDNAQNANGVAGIDVDVVTMACWVYAAATGAGQSIFFTASEIAGGNSAHALSSAAPASSGWRPSFFYRWSITGGTWRADDDLALNTWHHVVVVYDRTSTGNDAAIYVNGAAAALTKTQTPSGTVKTGVDSVIFGENVGLAGDFSGRIAESALWSRGLSAAEIQAVYRLSPLAAPSGLEAYWPMLDGGRERMQGAALTLSGNTTTAEHPPGVFYPRSSRVIVSPPAAVTTARRLVDGGLINAPTIGRLVA